MILEFSGQGSAVSWLEIVPQASNSENPCPNKERQGAYAGGPVYRLAWMTTVLSLLGLQATSTAFLRQCTRRDRTTLFSMLSKTPSPTLLCSPSRES